MIRVALGKYNKEGLYVTSRWLELPATEDEIEETKGWYIYEIDTDIERIKGGKYDLETLNKLAEFFST